MLKNFVYRSGDIHTATLNNSSLKKKLKTVIKVIQHLRKNNLRVLNKNLKMTVS